MPSTNSFGSLRELGLALLFLSSLSEAVSTGGRDIWRHTCLWGQQRDADWRRMSGYDTKTATCPLPVYSQAEPAMLLASTPWTHLPFCRGRYPANSFCVFTAASFDDGQGLSIVTTPEAASDAAAAIQGEQPPRVARRPYEVRDVPGKGKGGVATRRIRAGEPILVERPVLFMRTDAESESEGNERELGVALIQLPAESQARVQALARSTGGFLVEDVLRTNGLAVSLGGADHTGLYLEVARFNHACRPNMFWRFSPRTLAVEFVALRDIEAGEELTISYTHRDTVEETQAALLEHYGFRCSCEVCSSRREAQALDAKRQRLREIQAALEEHGTNEEEEDELEQRLHHELEHEQGHGEHQHIPQTPPPPQHAPAGNISALAAEMLAIVEGEDALRAPRGAHYYYLVMIAQAFWHAGDPKAAVGYTARALDAAVQYGGPDDEHVVVLREILQQMGWRG